MKIIFLDFDGVLNHWGGGSPRDEDSYIVDGEGGIIGSSGPRFLPLLPRLRENNVAVLNVLMAQAVAQWRDVGIVVSSSWRKIVSMGELLRHMGRCGVDMGAGVIDRTPSIPSANRGREIYAWLEEHRPGLRTRRGWCQIDGFVILDDDRDMAPLVPWLVQVNGEFGMTVSVVDMAMKALAQPWPPLALGELS